MRGYQQPRDMMGNPVMTPPTTCVQRNRWESTDATVACIAPRHGQELTIRT